MVLYNQWPLNVHMFFKGLRLNLNSATFGGTNLNRKLNLKDSLFRKWKTEMMLFLSDRRFNDTQVLRLNQSRVISSKWSLWSYSLRANDRIIHIPKIVYLMPIFVWKIKIPEDRIFLANNRMLYANYCIFSVKIRVIHGFWNFCLGNFSSTFQLGTNSG